MSEADSGAGRGGEARGGEALPRAGAATPRGRRRSLAWALVSVAVLGLGGLGTAAAQQRPRPVDVRWDYWVIRFDPNDYKDKDDYKDFLRREGGDHARAEGPFLEHVLKTAGQQGWELTHVDRPRPAFAYLVLRRRAP